MPELTESVANLIQEFSKLPGIGKKSAERLTYHVLRVPDAEALALAEAIRRVKENVRYCRTCCNLSEEDECAICRDPQRQRDLLCVVEQPRDLIALEQTGIYHGLYHVLLGRIAPLDGIGPDQLTIDALVRRVREGTFQELIMGRIRPRRGTARPCTSPTCCRSCRSASRVWRGGSRRAAC